MDISAFWKVIDQARGAKGQAPPKLPSADPEVLRKVLEKLSDSDVRDFVGLFDAQLRRLNQWPIWGAGYVIAGGMSDDSFHYFRSWLIGKGQAAVDTALSDPDSLGPFVDDEEVDNELLEYTGIELLEERELDDPRDELEGSADDAPTGEPFDEETVVGQFPKLAKTFWS